MELEAYEAKIMHGGEHVRERVAARRRIIPRRKVASAQAPALAAMAEVKTNGFVVAVVLIILIVFMTNTGGGGKSTISQEEVKLLRERVAQLETKLGATLVNSGRARSMSTLTSSSGAVMQRPAAAAGAEAAVTSSAADVKPAPQPAVVSTATTPVESAVAAAHAAEGAKGHRRPRLVVDR